MKRKTAKESVKGNDDLQEVIGWFDLKLASVSPHFILNTVVYRCQNSIYNH